MTAKSNAQLLTDIQNYQTDPGPDRQASASTVS